MKLHVALHEALHEILHEILQAIQPAIDTLGWVTIHLVTYTESALDQQEVDRLIGEALIRFGGGGQ